MHSNRSWWVHRRPLHHPTCLPLRIKTCGNFFAQHPLRNHHVGDFSSTQRVRISFPILESGHYLVETCDCRIWLEVQNCESQLGWSVFSQGALLSLSWGQHTLPGDWANWPDWLSNENSQSRSRNHIFWWLCPCQVKICLFLSDLLCSAEWGLSEMSNQSEKTMYYTSKKVVNTWMILHFISSAPKSSQERLSFCQKFACSMFNLVGFVWSFLIVFW